MTVTLRSCDVAKFRDLLLAYAERDRRVVPIASRFVKAIDAMNWGEVQWTFTEAETKVLSDYVKGKR